MRVALIQSDATASDGRALAVGRVLRSLGHEATLIVPQTSLQPARPAAALAWQAEGFAWIPVGAGHLPPGQPHYPRDRTLITAHALAPLVLAFDAAWFFESEWAMPALRERRFFDRKLPLVVLDVAPGPELIPASLEDTNRVFARNYAAQWADLVYAPALAEAAAPTEAMVREVEDLWTERLAAPPITLRKPLTSPAATVCIPYYEEPEFLPEVLKSLERQTSSDFTVIVVNDGSPSAEARAAFDACAARYADRGWKFLHQPNKSAGGARNRAVEEATTEFICFIDADDLAMPKMIERFLRGILLTGDDCLVARNYAFQDDPNGPCTMLYDPPGNNLIGSMGDDMHGASCIFVRREAFLRIGGFTEMRGVSFDDYELHIRMNLANQRWDVFPEFIYRYRTPRAQGVSRSTSAYENLARVTRWYRERLQPYGLGQLPLAFASAYWKLEHGGDRMAELDRTLAARRPRPSPRGRELKLLMVVANFPYELMSGWHSRVRQMVRYFGSRYELTLVTSMPRELLASHRKESFQYLHSVLGVEGSNRSAATGNGLPFRIREMYTDNLQAALQSLPTDAYHAAIIDQIFMAEARRDIDTLSVLTEHNIESRLLRQASERAWSEDSLPEHYRNALREAVRLEEYEDRVWAEFPLRAAVSAVDRAEMDRRSPGRTVVAPNGADPASWLADARFEARTVLFAGHLAYMPNVDAIQFLLAEIWPRVRRHNGSARLILAGRTPSPTVVAAVEAAGGATAGIELVASPESMDAVARRASMTIAPLRLGSGTRCKILESMAWGLPVVSTTLGAEGIAVEDGEHVLLRDDPDAFAEGMLQLLSDEPLWRKLREASGALVRERYSWDRVFDDLNDALVELIP